LLYPERAAAWTEPALRAAYVSYDTGTLLL
jgi:hypothetical protein